MYGPYGSLGAENPTEGSGTPEARSCPRQHRLTSHPCPGSYECHHLSCACLLATPACLLLPILDPIQPLSISEPSPLGY